MRALTGQPVELHSEKRFLPKCGRDFSRLLGDDPPHLCGFSHDAQAQELTVVEAPRSPGTRGSIQRYSLVHAVPFTHGSDEPQCRGVASGERPARHISTLYPVVGVAQGTTGVNGHLSGAHSSRRALPIVRFQTSFESNSCIRHDMSPQRIVPFPNG